MTAVGRERKFVVRETRPSMSLCSQGPLTAAHPPLNWRWPTDRNGRGTVVRTGILARRLVAGICRSLGMCSDAVCQITSRFLQPSTVTCVTLQAAQDLYGIDHHAGADGDQQNIRSDAHVTVAGGREANLYD